MGDMVADGAEFMCPLCTCKLKLKTLNSSTKAEGKLVANTNNHMFPPPGGQCLLIPNAPAPCIPSTTVASHGQSPVDIDGTLGLGKGCQCLCTAKGGMLSCTNANQGVSVHDGAKGAEALAAIAGLVGGGGDKKDEEDHVQPEKYPNEEDTENKGDPKFKHGFDSPIDSHSANVVKKSGKGQAYQSHHIVEQRHLRNWKTKTVNPRSAPAQILSQKQHTHVTKVLNKRLPTGKNHSPSKVKQAYLEAYKKLPEYQKAVKEFFKNEFGI